nr:hypothetical protein [Tanacetum cinerariifolium]
MDAGGGRKVDSRKEYVVVNNHVERVSRQTFPVDSGKQNEHMAPPKLAPKVPSYSEAVSYQNTKYTCSVGTIKCEIVKHDSCSRLNGSTPGSKKFNADQTGAGTNPVIAEAASDVVVENQIPESLLSTLNSLHVVIPTQENQPAKGRVGSEFVCTQGSRPDSDLDHKILFMELRSVHEVAIQAPNKLNFKSVTVAIATPTETTASASTCHAYKSISIIE